jgi:hypothetical protein
MPRIHRRKVNAEKFAIAVQLERLKDEARGNSSCDSRLDNNIWRQVERRRVGALGKATTRVIALSRFVLGDAHVGQ